MMNQKQSIREARASANRPDDGEAFLPDSAGKHNSLVATDGESFAEEYIASALGGEPVEMDAADEVVEEEWGGPFLELDAEGAGASNDEGEALHEPPRNDKLPPRLQ